MRLASCILAAGLFLTTAALPAFAQSHDAEAFARRILGKPIGKKTGVCFQHTFTDAELAAHAQQKVTMMVLLVTADKDEPRDTPTYDFRMGVQLRGQSGRFESAGPCGEANITPGVTSSASRVACTVPREGGGIEFSPASDNASVTVSLQRVRIWRHGEEEASERNRTSLEAGADDRRFSLERASIRDCLPLINHST